jgi:hypothetical protein
LFIGNLLNQFASVFVDDAYHGNIRCAVDNEGDFVLLAEELSGIYRLDGLERCSLIFARR